MNILDLNVFTVFVILQLICIQCRDFNETDAERVKRLGADRVKHENKLEAQWKQFSSTPTIRVSFLEAVLLSQENS